MGKKQKQKRYISNLWYDNIISNKVLYAERTQDYSMHDNARSRLLKLTAEAPRTQRARIRMFLPEITAARAAGRTWAEIGEALGVTRSTLLAAVRGAKVREAASMKAPPVAEVAAAKVEAAKVEEARPSPEPGPIKSKITRWGE